MTIYSQNEDMVQAMVSELKAKLSAYLAKVRQGETVLVCERKTPIARIVPYEGEPEDLLIERASLPGSELIDVPSVRLLKPLDPIRLLRDDRDSR